MGAASTRGRSWGLKIGLWAGLLASACAPTTGWDRTEARVCQTQALVCLGAQPDRPVEFRLGDVALVPGECAQVAHGGSLRVGWVDRRGRVHGQRVWLGRHRRTDLTLVGRDKLRVVGRSPCDQTLPEGATVRRGGG